jgi:hypothetical protein
MDFCNQANAGDGGFKCDTIIYIESRFHVRLSATQLTVYWLFGTAIGATTAEAMVNPSLLPAQKCFLNWQPAAMQFHCGLLRRHTPVMKRRPANCRVCRLPLIFLSDD